MFKCLRKVFDISLRFLFQIQLDTLKNIKNMPTHEKIITYIGANWLHSYILGCSYVIQNTTLHKYEENVNHCVLGSYAMLRQVWYAIFSII